MVIINQSWFTMNNQDFLSFGNFDLLPPDELLQVFSEFEEGRLPSSTSAASFTSSRDESEGSRTPRVPKNDIKRHFPKTFISALNSGSCEQIQALSRAFIRDECVVRWSALWPSFSAARIPTLGTARGPEQFAHLVLGSWIVFPDMVVTKVASWIVASTTMPGRAMLTIDVDIVATKTSFLSCNLWLPPANQLPALYRARTAMQLQATINLFHSTSPAESVPTLSSPKNAPSENETTTVVPEGYVQALYQSALPMLPPIPMQLRGQFCFDFDEQNRIVQLSFSVVLV